MSWRDEPITEKQKRFIMEMNEFSEFPLPVFNGTTKGEAINYINENLKNAHESFNPNEDSYGNQD